MYGSEKVKHRPLGILTPLTQQNIRQFDLVIRIIPTKYHVYDIVYLFLCTFVI